MRKISIALRRLGTNELPGLTRAELRAFQRDYLKRVSDVAGLPEVLADSETEDGHRQKAPLAEVDIHPGERTVSAVGPARTEVVRPHERPLGFDSTSSPQGPSAHITRENEDDSVSKESPTSQIPWSRSGTAVLFSQDTGNGDGFSATFRLIDAEQDSGGAELTVYSHGTKPLDPEGLTCQPVKFNFPVDGSVQMASGRAEETGEDCALLTLHGRAMELTSLTSAGKDAGTTVAFEGPPARRLAVPFEVEPFKDTTLVCANATESTVVVRLHLLDESGRTVQNPNLYPLSAKQQLIHGLGEYFESLRGVECFKGIVVAEVLGEGLIWFEGYLRTNGTSIITRRALNMNINLEELKSNIARELKEVEEREASLREQELHVDAVLRLLEEQSAKQSGPSKVDYKLQDESQEEDITAGPLSSPQINITQAGAFGS